MKIASMNEQLVNIPAHLPKRLAICYYGWDWLTSALPDEAYGNLDRAMQETRERGFNCIRADMGLGLLYNWNGNRRGKLRFDARLVGANSNLQCVDARGGVIHDVWERVMLLFNLAKKYDLYIIGTSWLYQDFLTEIADNSLRLEIVSVPYNERLMMLANQWDRLLNDLKERGLAHRLAFVELVNEMGSTPCSAAKNHKGTPSFEEWLNGGPEAASHETLRELARAALAFLQERHPDVLITVDLGNASSFSRLLPDNAQIADHHVYSNRITQEIMKAVGLSTLSEKTGPVLEGNDILQSLLKNNIMSWEEINRRGKNTKKGWRPIAWFYQNIDQEKYDAWCLAHYCECRGRVKKSVKQAFRTAANFATPRRLPLVVDEGYIWYPPLHSRFVMTHDGRWGEEIAITAAIKTGHWGIMPTGYFRPNTPLVWYNDSQCEWIHSLNHRILHSCKEGVSPGI